MNTYKILINNESEFTISGEELLFSTISEYGDKNNVASDTFIFENEIDNSLDNLTTVAQLENLNNEIQSALKASPSNLVSIKISIESLVLRQDVPLFDKLINFVEYRKGLMTGLTKGPEADMRLICQIRMSKREVKE